MSHKDAFISRLQFLEATALTSAIGFTGAANSMASQCSCYDLLLKRGHVMDPANNVDGVMDVAVTGKKTAAVQPNIPSNGVRKVVDVSGFYVTPGLIDIHTHVFAQQSPIIVPPTVGGKLNPAMMEVRKRRVYFDVGHGSASFWWRNAVPAIQQGFQPESISTEKHHGNLHQFVISNNNVASKCLAMGESLNDVIRQLTVHPAREIRPPELGTLSVGSEADIAVLELLHGHFSYADCGFARLDGNQKLMARMVAGAGAVVFNSFAMSMVEWEKAPPQYFKPRWVMAGNFPRRVGKAEG